MADSEDQARALRYAKLAEVFAPVAVEIGHVTIAWNNLHFLLERIFATACNAENRQIGAAIWHALASDSAQRDILSAAIDVTLAQNNEAHAAIKWLLNMVEKIAGRRNDVTHTSLGWGVDERGNVIIEPNAFIKTARTARLRGKELAKEFGTYLTDLRLLHDFAVGLDLLAEYPSEQFPLPDRPLLQSIPPDQQAIQKPRTKKKPRLQRQPRSSGA